MSTTNCTRFMATAALAAGTLLPAHGSQMKYVNDVILDNQCASALAVHVENYSNMDDPPRDFTLPVGMQETVAAYVSLGEMVQSQIAADYKLTIQMDGVRVLVTQEKMLALLKAATFSETRSHRQWTLHGQDLCPKPIVRDTP